ncbi:MAG: acetyltransferase [Colwellia polaris]|jgi:UDP-N-acetylbacillosamine N-acetyltransferase|uniref:acetyltransferase n=1 Tax=Colwellia polaris TaxID=326537 RepID=UPI000A16FD6B|nr:acetyltransferase [Colwellia polaris]|tara:strand:+ start:23746 stop:24384 length:639 start_codon:yes stop_codon:yes gene_type:complete
MNKNKTLVIIGAGGHGLVVADCALSLGYYNNIIFLDDCLDKLNANSHWQVSGPTANWVNYRENADFIVAIGSNTIRAKLIAQLVAKQCHLATLIHPTAFVSQHSSISYGVVIFANAVVNIGARIDEGCIINTAATIDHDCHIQAYCHISPGVNIAGGVKVGKLSWLGIGSAVVEYITIAPNTQSGAGAVITKSTQSNQLYMGVPALPVRSLI